MVKRRSKTPILIQTWPSRRYVLQCVLASVLTKYVNMQYCINSRVCAAAEQGFGTIMLLRRQIKIRLPMLEFQSHGSQIDLFVEGRTTDRKKALVNKSFVCSIDGTKWQEESVLDLKLFWFGIQTSIYMTFKSCPSLFFHNCQLTW